LFIDIVYIDYIHCSWITYSFNYRQVRILHFWQVFVHKNSIKIILAQISILI